MAKVRRKVFWAEAKAFADAKKWNRFDYKMATQSNLTNEITKLLEGAKRIPIGKPQLFDPVKQKDGTLKIVMRIPCINPMKK